MREPRAMCPGHGVSSTATITGLKRPEFWGKEEIRKIRKGQPRDRKGSHCESSAKMISFITTVGTEK